MSDSPTVPRTDHINLELPLAPQYGRVMRIAAAHLALRRGFSLHEIDDLRLAMDEAAVMLLGPGLGEGRLDVSYSLDPDCIRIVVRVLSDSGAPIPDERLERFAVLAGELVDSYTIDPIDRRLEVSKTRVAR